MKEYDVIVVGGGPIGGYIAARLVEKKYKTAIFEKNKEIGKPVNCAGLITSRVFDIVNIDKKEVVQNEIKGANIYSPSENKLTIGGDKIHALVIDRECFDKELVNNAEILGADVFLGEKITSAKRKNKHIEIKTENNTCFNTKILIGADGPYSTVRKQFDFPSPKEFLYGFGAELSNTNLDPNYVDIFVGNNIAPGFFAWIIPTDKNGSTARIGLCTGRQIASSPKKYFKSFMKNSIVKNMLKDVKIERNIGGIIPVGFLKNTVDDNVLIVGDAASQVKPTSGGGIYSGLLCANHCISTVFESLDEQDYSSSFLKRYEKLWIKEIGSEIKKGMFFRSIFNRLSDDQFEKYMDKFQSQKIIETINKYGDIDYPSKLLKPLLKKAPSLLRLAPELLKK